MTGDLPAGEAQSHDRFEWVDAARGIGVVAVVAGHVWTAGPLRDALYSFHMPLFFLLSGYLFRPRPTGRFAWAQITSQGLTYIVYLLLILAADLLIEGMRDHRPIFSRWPQDIWPLLIGGSALKGPFTVFWFIPCLLAARIIFNAIGGRLPDPLGRGWIGIAGISLIVAMGIGAATDYSPLGLLALPMALFLLWAGAAGRAFGWRRGLIWLLLPLSLCGLMLLPPINMKAGDYGVPILSLAGALATSVLIFRLAAHGLPGKRGLPGKMSLPGMTMWRMLGRASLVIMYVHVPVVHYLAPYAGRPLLFAAGLILPCLCWWLAGQSRITRRLFLGHVG